MVCGIGRQAFKLEEKDWQDVAGGRIGKAAEQT
jgi:hypothetical protein